MSGTCDHCGRYFEHDADLQDHLNHRHPMTMAQEERAKENERAAELARRRSLARLSHNPSAYRREDA